MTDTDLISRPEAALFKPFDYKGLHLPNRIVMAPMTRMMSPDGYPGADTAGYYRRRAEGGVGLIVTEGTFVHPLGSSSRNAPDFWGDALEGWAHVVREVHAAGGKIMPQLWHVGIMRSVEWDVHYPELPSVGPSGLGFNGEVAGRAMTESEIAEVIEAFAQAAADAQRIGFDGVEIHGAHGYLVDQFLWDVTNRRVDRYGGDRKARSTFAFELVKAIRARVGDDYPIIMRFSQWKGGVYDARMAETPDELLEILAPMVDAGVDIFHASTRRFQVPEFPGSDMNIAGWIKKLTGLPTITVGTVGLDGTYSAANPEDARPAGVEEVARRLDEGEFDLVAVGRALLTDPQWPAKIREGRTGELMGYRPSDRNVLT